MNQDQEQTTKLQSVRFFIIRNNRVFVLIGLLSSMFILSYVLHNIEIPKNEYKITCEGLNGVYSNWFGIEKCAYDKQSQRIHNDGIVNYVIKDWLNLYD